MSNKPYKGFEPKWLLTPAPAGSYRSIFRWGDPAFFKYPKESLYKMMKEAFHMTDEDFRDYTDDIGFDQVSLPDHPSRIAPEHLEIMTADPRALLPAIRNAGAVFLGAWSPEPLGDYLAGPDHVLPTSGTARFFSPLSVDSFLKTMSVIQYDRASLAPIAGQIVTLAESEHLTAHANSIRVRFE